MDSMTGHIDWLTFSGKYALNPVLGDEPSLKQALAVAERAYSAVFDGSVTWSKGKSKPFYAWSFHDQQTDMRVWVSLDGQRQGWVAELSGETCKHVSDWGRVATGLVLMGARGTRVDVAFDQFNSDETVEDLIEEYAAHHGHKKNQAWSHIHSKRGSTLYIGSRQSEQFVRIYDKGRQMGLDVPWKRAEIEFKGEFARTRWLDILENPLLAARNILEKMALPSSRLAAGLDHLATGGEVLRAYRPQTVDKTFGWLMSQVLSAFTGLVERDETAAALFMTECDRIYTAWVARKGNQG